MRNSNRISVSKLEKKRPLGKTRYRWEDNTKVDTKTHLKMWNGFISVRIGSDLQT
jgi:hypothetical protein